MEQPGADPPRRRSARVRVRWDADRLKALRQHLGLTQQELAEELGTRQQTISEWETGRYQPRGSSATLLTFVAERAGFEYAARPARAEEGVETPSEPSAGSPGL